MLAILKTACAMHGSVSNLPALWCRSLMSSGHTAALLGLDASMRASIGAGAETCLRLAQILEDFAKPEGEQPDVFAAESYTEKPLLSQCLVHISELSQALADKSDMFSVEQINAVLKALASKAASTAMAIAKETSELKMQKLKPAMPKMQDLEKCLTENDIENGTVLLKEMNDGQIVLEANAGLEFFQLTAVG